MSARTLADELTAASMGLAEALERGDASAARTKLGTCTVLLEALRAKLAPAEHSHPYAAGSRR